MAGGVTSGIIYPGAVSVIARRYRFRCIGGTSVGALAAAVTAAAEYGRTTGANPDAFNYVSSLPEGLGQRAGGRSRLYHLFAPEPGTRPLFALASPLFRGGRRSDLLLAALRVSATWRIAVPAVVAAIAAIVLVLALWRSGTASALLLGVPAGACLLLLVWLAALASAFSGRWLPALRGNDYGLCRGSTGPGVGATSSPRFEGLTDWMHRAVQTAAGRGLADAPLTFGDLWSAGLPTRPTDRFAAETAPRVIELAMIASDISRNRSVQLPFVETPSPVYVDLAVLARFFPKPVVDWMEAHASQWDPRIALREGVVRLPSPADLPVVFAARLSLSFPVLLSALPLLTPDFAAPPGPSGIALRSLWISDGGLTSNFPIHFFDAPVPSRPTFCLNLVGFGSEREGARSAEPSEASEGPVVTGAPDGPEALVGSLYERKPIEVARSERRTAGARPQDGPLVDPEPGDDVWGMVDMARGNRVKPAPFAAFDEASGLRPFLKAILDTARFWSDNQMLLASGVRDRVVDIALRDDEGGLNLDMSPRVIRDLDRRGRAAGLLISRRFDPDAAIDPETGDFIEHAFPNHRWVRYRNFMAAAEDTVRRFATARRSSDAAATARSELGLDDLIEGLDRRVGYQAPPAARAFYRDATRGLEGLAQTMSEAARADPAATFDPPRTDRSAHAKAPRGAGPRPTMRMSLRPVADGDPRGEREFPPDDGGTPYR